MAKLKCAAHGRRVFVVRGENGVVVLHRSAQEKCSFPLKLGDKTLSKADFKKVD